MTPLTSDRDRAEEAARREERTEALEAQIAMTLIKAAFVAAAVLLILHWIGVI